MRHVLNLLIFFLLLAFTGSSLAAQGSGTPARKSVDPYSVTKNITGTVAELNRDDGTLLVVDERSGKRWMFRTGETTKFRADKGVLGKSEISWADLEIGQRVRISFKGATLGETMSLGGEVLEIKVKKPKTT